MCKLSPSQFSSLRRAINNAFPRQDVCLPSPSSNMPSINGRRTAIHRTTERGPRLTAKWNSGDHCACCNHGVSEQQCEKSVTVMSLHDFSCQFFKFSRPVMHTSLIRMLGVICVSQKPRNFSAIIKSTDNNRAYIWDTFNLKDFNMCGCVTDTLQTETMGPPVCKESMSCSLNTELMFGHIRLNWLHAALSEVVTPRIGTLRT
jgi:hypothetical protein